MDGKPKPGNTIYIRPTGTSRIEQRTILPGTVARVGRKYLYLTNDLVFDMETRISVCGGWRYYLSVAERLDEVETSAWLRTLRIWADGVSSRRASLETLRQVGALLGLPAPEREEA